MLLSHMKSDFPIIFYFRDYAKSAYCKKARKTFLTNILRAIIFVKLNPAYLRLAYVHSTVYTSCHCHMDMDHLDKLLHAHASSVHSVQSHPCWFL